MRENLIKLKRKRVGHIKIFEIDYISERRDTCLFRILLDSAFADVLQAVVYMEENLKVKNIY
jgi:hypothetical protein